MWKNGVHRHDESPKENEESFPLRPGNRVRHRVSSLATACVGASSQYEMHHEAPAFHLRMGSRTRPADAVLVARPRASPRPRRAPAAPASPRPASIPSRSASRRAPPPRWPHADLVVAEQSASADTARAARRPARREACRRPPSPVRARARRPALRHASPCDAAARAAAPRAHRASSTSKSGHREHERQPTRHRQRHHARRTARARRARSRRGSPRRRCPDAPPPRRTPRVAARR